MRHTVICAPRVDRLLVDEYGPYVAIPVRSR